MKPEQKYEQETEREKAGDLLFREFEKEPWKVQLMAILCSEEGVYQNYKESFDDLRFAVRRAVNNNEMSPEDGRTMLKKYRF